MSEGTRGTDLLTLSDDFPPVNTAEWDAAVRKDLNGADYEKKLVWRTDEGLAVRPYYRREDLAGLGDVGKFVPAREWEEAQDWTAPAGAIRADYLHEAGGTAVQELAFALAEGTEKLSAAIESGSTVDTSAGSTVFVYAAGSNFFFEIAKLRAARLLWSTAVSAYGPADPQSVYATIHVRTARINKSVLDPWTNLLRVTTEALSAVVGGCDALTVEPFGFDAHLAQNVQHILREEAHIGHVADPAGGSYYVESLTASLAREAWRLFQQTEEEGGWTAALASGFIANALLASRQAKANAVALRRRTVVGVNNYPNLAEKHPGSVSLPPLSSSSFAESRFAEPFEAIRRRTWLHYERAGRWPKVLLLTRGDVRLKGARANFCLNLFGCAGFDIVESDQYGGSSADLIVLCSSDPEYLPFAKEVCSAVNVPVLVAGNPKDQIQQLQEMGVQGFVHIGSNAVETLTEWQNRLGLEKLPA